MDRETEEYLENIYATWKKGLVRLESKNNGVDFIQVSGLLNIIITWDDRRSLIQKEDYERAIVAMRKTAENERGNMRDIMFEHVGSLEEKRKQYFRGRI